MVSKAANLIRFLVTYSNTHDLYLLSIDLDPLSCDPRGVASNGKNSNKKPAQAFKIWSLNGKELKSEVSTKRRHARQNKTKNSVEHGHTEQGKPEIELEIPFEQAKKPDQVSMDVPKVFVIKLSFPKRGRRYGGGRRNAPVDDGEHGGDELNGGEEETAGSFAARLKAAFNTEEFLRLANKVVNDGDKKSMDALNQLKARWERTTGEAPLLMLEAAEKGAAAPSLAPPNPNRRKEVAPSRVITHDVPAPLAGPSPVHRDGIPPMESSSTILNIFIGKAFASVCSPGEAEWRIVVRLMLEMVNAGAHKWETTAVGYFLGRKPPFLQVQAYFRSIWTEVRDVIATINGFFFITFRTRSVMDDAIDGGPWFFRGHPLVLQRWEPGMALCKHSHTQVPVWIKLRHLRVELWMEDGLSTVASGIGKPLYPDSMTKTCTRLDFARVCVMLDYSSTLPKHLVVVTPMEDGSEVLCRVDVEYEWIPSKCTTCRALGHSTAN
ncbi:UNVERIFIED_CONTAM: hypothetical protein Slati_3470000 [Sesamum latifolium]|uniref:DUF4283 domain-containing protein n=1 Tax=Sesamum latifolium TaxID=2727402 RepID=A0AAW2UM17_9LAMI